MAQFQQKGSAITYTDWSFTGWSVSIAMQGERIAVASPTAEGDSLLSGIVRIFDWNGMDWVQVGDDLSGHMVNDVAGRAGGEGVSLSSDGSRVAISYRFSEFGDNYGAVRVYELSDEGWVQVGSILSGEDDLIRFGASVELNANGDKLIVGAIGEFDEGYARVFEYDGLNWVQMGQDLNGENINDSFGRSVTIDDDGDFVAIGAIGADGDVENTGSVSVYTWREEEGWQVVGSQFYGQSTGDWFGRSVKLSHDGDYLVVGAPLNELAAIQGGQVRVFRVDERMEQVGQTLNNGGLGDRFGSRVDISFDGQRIAVSSTNYDNVTDFDAGRVQIFDYDPAADSWNEFDAPGQIGDDGDDYCGYSLSLSQDGNTIIIGSPWSAKGETTNGGDGTAYSLGNPDIDPDFMLTVYPNPVTNGVVYIEGISEGAEGEITFLTPEGEIVLQTPLSKVIDCDLREGKYLMKITTPEGDQTVQLLVK